MVSYYLSVTPVIRNHPIYMQYSTHKELKTDNSPNQVVRRAFAFYSLSTPQMAGVLNSASGVPSPFSAPRLLCRPSTLCTAAAGSPAWPSRRTPAAWWAPSLKAPFCESSWRTSSTRSPWTCCTRYAAPRRRLARPPCAPHGHLIKHRAAF